MIGCIGVTTDSVSYILDYTVKKFSYIPVPSHPKLSLGGNIKLFPPTESLLSDIPAGDGIIETFFFSVDLPLKSYNYITLI